MKTKKKKGFTLTELIVVIVIIGVLAAVLIPTLTGYITKAQNSKDETLVSSLNRNLKNNMIIEDDLDFYTAYDVQAYLKSVDMENIEVANKDSIILFDAEDYGFLLVKKDEISDYLEVNEFAYHISEYYSINVTKMLNISNSESKNVQIKPLGYEKLADESDELHRAFIVSINGNEISETVAAFMKINGNMIDKNSEDYKEYEKIVKTFKNVKGETLSENLSSALSKTLFIDQEKTFYINSNYEIVSVTNKNNFSNPDSQTLTRIAITAETTEVDLTVVQNLGQSTIIINNSVDNVTLPNNNLATNSIEISGNIEVIDINDENPNDLDKVIIKNLEEAILKPMMKELINVSTRVKNLSQLDEILNCYYKINNDENVKKLLTKYNVNISLDNTITVIGDFEINKQVTIPSGITLFIPYSDKDDAYEYGKSGNISKIYLEGGVEDTTNRYRNLIISEKGHLKVEGEVLVGGVVNGTTQPVICHTSGLYGQITNNGKIELCNGSKLNVYGYVIGDGEIESNGATIIQQLTIGDFAGGTNTSLLITNKRTPFSQYNLANIWCKVILDSNSSYQGRGAVYAKESLTSEERKWYSIDSVSIVGKSGTSSLIRMNAGSKVIITYSPDEQLTNDRTRATSLGKLKISIEGGAETGSFTISLAGYDADTSKFVMPIPYNLILEFNNSNEEKTDEYKITSQFALLPGSELKVGNGTKLTITSSGGLAVLDSLSELSFSEKVDAGTYDYPVDMANSPAKLVVNGTIQIDGSFGGDIVSEIAGSKLIIGSSAIGANTGIHNCIDKENHCTTKGCLHTGLRCKLKCNDNSTEYPKCYSTYFEINFGYDALLGSTVWNGKNNKHTYQMYCLIKNSVDNKIIAHTNTTYTYNSQGYWE